MTATFSISPIVASCLLVASVVLTLLPLTVSAFSPISAGPTHRRPHVFGSALPTLAVSPTHLRLLPPLEMSTGTETKITGPDIEVIHQPSKDFLDQKGCLRWGTWGCDVSKFPWTYDSNESCYLLKGKVTVTPTDGRKPVTFGAGDFVTFPAGMSCTWDVSEAVQKHFMFF